MLTDTSASRYAKAMPLHALDVCWTDGFHRQVWETNADATVPELLEMFEDPEISHILENFRICAGDAEGSHDGTVFGDGDFYKWLESAVYVACTRKDEDLLKKIDGYIDLIGRAQQEDGYLSTKQILGERENNGVHRMGDINDFEVYNFGHLFTAAALHCRLTGKRNLLEIASRCADYLDRMYEEAKKKDEVQTAVCPSHYMGLVELYRVTSDAKYLRLARTAIELRDSVKNGLDDNQDRMPLKSHRTIIGHAVRANYLYAGLADLVLEEGGEDYKEVLDSVFSDLVSHKLYLTGGCGALYNGASPYGNFFRHQLVHQAYGHDYELPNMTAYNETCAGVGLILWAYRMFLLEPEAAYFDLIERVLLNTSLAAVSLDGMRFFYENMLERSHKPTFEPIWSMHRTSYITSYCCPPNLARLLAQTNEYAYLLAKGTEVPTIYTGIYGASRAKFAFPGLSFTLVQETDYPFDGRIRLRLEEVEHTGAADKTAFALKLRIPAWAENASLCVTQDGERACRAPEGSGARYETVEVRDPEGLSIELTLEMPARLTAANPLVEADRGRAAVERGPLVYCAEEADLEEGLCVRDLRLIAGEDFAREECRIAGRRLVALDTQMLAMDNPAKEGLYGTVRPGGMRKVKVRLIPYFAWNNRAPEEDREMAVFFPVNFPV